MRLRLKIVFWIVIAALLVQLVSAQLVSAQLVSAQPISAQRRAAPKKPVVEAPPQQQTVSFDMLLAADTYKVYGEVRNVGQLIRSDGVKDLVDPVLKLAAPPKEFKTLIRFLNTRAEALSTSRLLFAAMPSKPKLPQFLVAIEFASAEEAQKFEPQLRDFLPKFLPTPAPQVSPAPAPSPEAKPSPTPSTPAYVLKQVGQLVFVTDAPFALKDLKPKGARLLAEDQNFRLAHERFTTDSVFLYVDFAGIQRDEEKEQKERAEAEQKRMEEAQAKLQTKPEETTPEEAPPPPEAPEGVGTPEDPSTTVATAIAQLEDQPKPDPIEPALSMIAGSFFQGQAKWPDGFGASLNFDGDAYVLRVLLVNTSPEKPSAIPFFPHLISGPPLTPEAPSILPADTELFVSASLDLPQIHEAMVRESKTQYEWMIKFRANSPAGGEADSPFAVIEKRLGVKLKDDVLPLLGNEIALTIPMSIIDGGSPSEAKTDASVPDNDQKTEEQKKVDQGPSVIVAISIKDREGVKALLPKIIDSVGFKGASKLAQTERRDDTELVVYADAFAYALVGNFLVLSPDVKATRHVVDSYLKHETLSSNTNFRNYTRWHPRQVLGQVYLSPALMESYNSFAKDATASINEQLRDFLMLVSPVPQPVTYALANEGQGPLHELHIPKNLVMMIAASVSADSNQPESTRNEAVTQSVMNAIARAEETFKSTEGNGRFGSLEELMNAGLVPKNMAQDYGYKIDVSVSGTRYEVTAVPTEYGKTGKLSFFMDETGVVRAGDHAGAAATISDKARP